MNRLRH